MRSISCLVDLTQLASALADVSDPKRDAARQALRGFIDRIVIPPGDGLVQVVGNLGEMLTAAVVARAQRLSAMLVAGARLALYRKLCWAAA